MTATASAPEFHGGAGGLRWLQSDEFFVGALRDQIRARLEDLEQSADTLRAVLDGLDDAVLLFDGDRAGMQAAA